MVTGEIEYSILASELETMEEQIMYDLERAYQYQIDTASGKTITKMTEHTSLAAQRKSPPGIGKRVDHDTPQQAASAHRI